MNALNQESLLFATAAAFFAAIGIGVNYKNTDIRKFIVSSLVFIVVILISSTFNAVHGYGFDKVLADFFGKPVAYILGMKTKPPAELSENRLREIEKNKKLDEIRIQEALNSAINEIEDSKRQAKERLEAERIEAEEAEKARQETQDRARRLESAAREPQQSGVNRSRTETTYPLGPNGPPMTPFRY